MLELVENCQIFTPQKNAIFLLNKLGYKKDIYNKKVMENSCGDGNILIEIVKRYIVDCLNHNFSKSEIKKLIEENIYAAEIDKIHLTKCKKRLDDLSAFYDLPKIKWNIINDNILDYHFDFKFDYVIGNPPYIVYRKLPKQLQKSLRNNFISCRDGQFDYCYAFIEFGVNILNGQGKLGYLIPNSIFKNKFANNLRELIKPFVKEIYDYAGLRQFENALTSTAILILDKKISKTKKIIYRSAETGSRILLKRNELAGKWIFSDKVMRQGKKSFGDYFEVKNTIATLRNDIYVLKDCCLGKDGYIYSQGRKFEKDLLFKAVAPKEKSVNGNEMIIFPYKIIEGKILKFKENELLEKYPCIYNYLLSNKEELLKRASEDNAQWFEYGRSQAINYLFKKMLLVSTVHTKQIKVYEIDESCIAYSGIFIVSKDKNIDLSLAKSILTSDELQEFLILHGINTGAGGSSVRLSVKDFKNYYFKSEEVKESA